MGNLEKPLTWGLTILLLGYLFVANCKCGEEASCTANNGFNIESENETIDVNQEIKIEIQVEDENLNVDSIVDAVLEDIDMEGNIDTVIKIDLVEETAE
ncbi:MAG TPA: hypothetical protein EYQ09_06045 [Flavobacteriales bacterium]|nr:hypothetical protein [Flavobacteriales bacterium]